jgi:AraC family transcriptional activator of pobA
MNLFVKTITVSGGKIIHVQPSPRARRLFWHLLGTSRARVTAPFSVDAFALTGATILWLESGRGEMRIKSGTYELRPGPFFWVFSVHQDRHYRPLGEKPYMVNTIRFSGPNLEAWLDELEVKRDPQFRIEPPQWIYDLRRELTRLATKQPRDWERRVHTLLTDLLSRLLAIRKPHPPLQHELPAPVLKVLDAIARDADRAWNVKVLPSLAGVSYTALRNLFQTSLHVSIHSFLQQQRLDRARVLLAERRLTVKQISEKLHFGNEFYFSNFFKAHTGESPTQFRQHLGLK